MYTYIYKKNIYVHGRVCNNNMYAWGKCGGKYNNMREGAPRSATDPKEKKERSSKYVCEEQRPYGWWKT